MLADRPILQRRWRGNNWVVEQTSARVSHRFLHGHPHQRRSELRRIRRPCLPVWRARCGAVSCGDWGWRNRVRSASRVEIRHAGL